MQPDIVQKCTKADFFYERVFELDGTPQRHGQRRDIYGVEVGIGGFISTEDEYL